MRMFKQAALPAHRFNRGLQGYLSIRPVGQGRRIPETQMVEKQGAAIFSADQLGFRRFALHWPALDQGKQVTCRIFRKIQGAEIAIALMQRTHDTQPDGKLGIRMAMQIHQRGLPG